MENFPKFRGRPGRINECVVECVVSDGILYGFMGAFHHNWELSFFPGEGIELGAWDCFGGYGFEPFQ